MYSLPPWMAMPLGTLKAPVTWATSSAIPSPSRSMIRCTAREREPTKMAPDAASTASERAWGTRANREILKPVGSLMDFSKAPMSCPCAGAP